MKFTDSVCIVTGASSGIGRASAIEMARRGATLALVSRNADALGEVLKTVSAHSPNSFLHACNVGDPAAVEKMISAVLERTGRIDLMFANAGFGHFRPLVDLDDDEIEEMVRTNVLGQIWCCKAVIPHMMERRRGHVVVMSSSNGRIPPPLMTVYNATKFAAVGFGETLLYEVEPYGIGVTIVYPGAIDTGFFGPSEFGALRTPKKLSPEKMARAICNGIERGAYDVTLPRVLRLPAILRVIAPPLVRNGVRRYAASVVPRPAARGGND